MVRKLSGFVRVGFSAALLVTVAVAADKPQPIPAGSSLHVRLDTTLTDKTNKTGDVFTGMVTEPIIVNGKEIVPKFSMVNGHVAFVKPSGRIAGKAQMRIVLDNLTTPDSVIYPLSGTLEDTQGGACGNTTVSGKGKADEEGTIIGCGKSKKEAAKAAAIAGGIGAGAGATVAMGQTIDCRYYGNCGGPGLGTDVGYGAAIGAGTALIYSLLKHEKHIVLVQGTQLLFTVNRTTVADDTSSGAQQLHP